MVIATAGTWFGPTASEAKTEVMCLQTTGAQDVPFLNTAVDQEHKKTNNFVCLGGVIS